MPIRKSRVATKKRTKKAKKGIPIYTAGTYLPPAKARKPRKTKAERKQEITLRATVLLENLLTKSEDYDRCVAYFKKNHKAETSLTSEEKLSLGTVIQYLVERSNQMQKTIEEVEKRERARADAVVAQFGEPKDVSDMTPRELEAEVMRLRRQVNGIRDNY